MITTDLLIGNVVRAAYSYATVPHNNMKMTLYKLVCDHLNISSSGFIYLNFSYIFLQFDLLYILSCQKDMKILSYCYSSLLL